MVSSFTLLQRRGTLATKHWCIYRWTLQPSELSFLPLVIEEGNSPHCWSHPSASSFVIWIPWPLVSRRAGQDSKTCKRMTTLVGRKFWAKVGERCVWGSYRTSMWRCPLGSRLSWSSGESSIKKTLVLVFFKLPCCTYSYHGGLQVTNGLKTAWKFPTYLKINTHKDI